MSHHWQHGRFQRRVPERRNQSRHRSRAASEVERGREVGFTLLELLVVVAVISVLGSLLVPATSKAIASARQAECRGNLRDMGLAITMYLADVEAYPITGGRFVLGLSDELGVFKLDDWKNALIPYVGVQNIGVGDWNKEATLRKLRCPQRAKNSDGVTGEGQYAYNAWGTANPRRFLGLGLNGRRSIHGEIRALSESEIRNPALMIVAGDVSPGPTETFVPRDNEWAISDGPPRVTFRSAGSFDVCSADQKDWPGSHHNGRANMLFADGHIESARQSTWISTNHAARARWNNDHEPHPETWNRP